jgi:hypothetical protein
MPVAQLDLGMTKEDMAAWLADENAMRDEISDEPHAPPFYASYVGWWGNPAATNGMDVPTIAYVNGRYRIWDGWHRGIIAALHEQPTMPVLLGIPPA